MRAGGGKERGGGLGKRACAALSPFAGARRAAAMCCCSSRKRRRDAIGPVEKGSATPAETPTASVSRRYQCPKSRGEEIGRMGLEIGSESVRTLEEELDPWVGGLGRLPLALRQKRLRKLREPRLVLSLAEPQRGGGGEPRSGARRAHGAAEAVGVVVEAAGTKQVEHLVGPGHNKKHRA